MDLPRRRCVHFLISDQILKGLGVVSALAVHSFQSKCVETVFSLISFKKNKSSEKLNENFWPFKLEKNELKTIVKLKISNLNATQRDFVTREWCHFKEKQNSQN